MGGLSTEKLNSKKTLLALIVTLLVSVLSVNLALVSDATLFAGFYLIAAALAAWLVSAISPILALAASIIGWAAAFLITKNPIDTLLSISYLPFSLSIPYVGSGKIKRSVAIGIGSACVTLCIVAVLLFLTYKRTGTVSLSAIRASFPFFFKQMSDVLYDSFSVNVAGDEFPLIAESNVTGYLNVIICLMPAAISALASVIGYIIAWIYKKLSELTETVKIPKDAWELIPSPITAIFFLIALITAMIFDTVGIITLTALNMFLILLPVILLTGLITSLTPKIANGIPRPRLFRPLTLIISAFNGVVPFASLCIFYGLFDSFRQMKFKRKPNNN